MGPNEFKAFALQCGAEVDLVNETVIFPINVEANVRGMNLYAEREDSEFMEKHTFRHVDRMTAEGLNSKAMIAMELGARDAVIQLQNLLAREQRIQMDNLSELVLAGDFEGAQKFLDNLKRFPHTYTQGESETADNVI